MAPESAELGVEGCDDLAVFRRVLEKNAGMVGAALSRGATVARGAVTRKLAPKAVPVIGQAGRAAQAVAPAVPLGQRVSKGWSEFKAGLGTGRRFNIGSAEAAQAAPSLWKSVGHNVADQAIGGAIGGTVIGGALGAYQAPKGEGVSGAMAGAGEGLKAGIVGGALAGAAGGALRHGRYKALLHTGSTPTQAAAVMSKSPLQNAKDAWANKGNPGSWQADAVEAAAVPATLVAENMAQGIGEKKQDKVASADTQAEAKVQVLAEEARAAARVAAACAERVREARAQIHQGEAVSKIAKDRAPKGKLKKRPGRAAMHLSRLEEMQIVTAARAILRAVRDTKLTKALKVPKIADMPHVVVVPMMGEHKSPAQLEADKRDRAAYETDKAVGKGVGPLVGAVGAEALLRSTLDPAVRANPAGPLGGLVPDSVPRKILLPGLGAAIGAYGAHRVIQARREARERASREQLAQEAAQAAIPAGSAPTYP